MKKCAYLLILLCAFTLCFAGYKLVLCVFHPVNYREEIEFYSKEYHLSPTLVASVINVESSYKTRAKSQKNALGLMQIKLDTANYLNDYYKQGEAVTEEFLFDEKNNIKYGCLYLKYLIDKFEDENTALSAYNAGETRVRAWLKDEELSFDGKTLSNIPYDETRNYVKKVQNNKRFYSKVFN